MFSWEFSEILKNNFFTEHLRRTASRHFHSLNNLTVFLQSSELIETRLFIFANMFYHGFQAWWISWALHLENFRSSRPQVFSKKGVLRNFEKFTECLFFNKVAGLRVATLSKKRLWHGCFPVNFCEVSKNTFSYRNTSGGCFWNFTKQMTHRSSRSHVFFKKGVRKNFTNFTGIFSWNLWNVYFFTE